MNGSSVEYVGRRVTRRRFISLAAGGACIGIAAPAHALDLFEELKKQLGGTTTSGLTTQEITDGLMEALRVGTERVVKQVGALNGYNLDPKIHIPLPGTLKNVQKVLKTIGMSRMADDLELRLNRAAETAAPQAKELFWQAISEMSFEDARKIYDGPDDAATRYFQGKMTSTLAKRMEPVVDRSLSDVGAIRSYDAMIGKYKSVPYVPDVKADLTGYVVEKGMDGIFYYVAKEEAAIRHDPAARTTDLLKKVFGAT